MSTASQKKCTASAPAPKRRLTETLASPATAVTPPDAKSTQQLGTLFFQSNGAQSGIEFSSATMQKEWWQRLIASINSNSCSGQSANLLTWIKPNQQKAESQSIVDTSVYRSMGELRMLYSQKFGDSASELRLVKTIASENE